LKAQIFPSLPSQMWLELHRIALALVNQLIRLSPPWIRSKLGLLLMDTILRVLDAIYRELLLAQLQYDELLSS
jgi:hypothetical protein